MAPAAELVWTNRQRTVPARQLNLGSARRIVDRAWPLVVAAQRRGTVLPEISEISFVLVSDARIAAVHGTFMRDPAPTDVITFLHGEIVISAETARREARHRRLPLAEEIARYAVHGLLHLAGWSDRDARAGRAMRTIQEKILRRAARGLC